MSIIIKDVTIPRYCWECFCNDDSHWCNLLKECTPYEDKKLDNCPLKEFEDKVDVNIYDVEEIHHNCTVQIWKNSITGDISIGWYQDE